MKKLSEKERREGVRHDHLLNIAMTWSGREEKCRERINALRRQLTQLAKKCRAANKAIDDYLDSLGFQP